MSTLAFIHRFEAGTRPEARPLLLLHGTGGDENDLVPLGRAIAPDAVTQQRRWRGSDLVMGIARSMCGLATAGGTRHHLDLRAGLHLREGGGTPVAKAGRPIGYATERPVFQPIVRNFRRRPASGCSVVLPRCPNGVGNIRYF
jgi:hypothetical protein